MTRILFYNVYGDADALVASAPGDVDCVQWGWTSELESARDARLAELGVSVSSLPSLVFQHGEAWVVLDLRAVEQPWTWDAVHRAQSVLTQSEVLP